MRKFQPRRSTSLYGLAFFVQLFDRRLENLKCMLKSLSLSMSMWHKAVELSFLSVSALKNLKSSDTRAERRPPYTRLAESAQALAG